jgi:hypothetical protein
MRERAQQVGGTLEIETVAGQGSCVRARFPLSDCGPAGESVSGDRASGDRASGDC